MWLFRGEGLERGRVGRAEVAHISPSYSPAALLRQGSAKDLGAFVSSLAKVPWSGPK